MYSNKADSTCRRVCQMLRQMSSAMRVLKKVSTTALSSPGVTSASKSRKSSERIDTDAFAPAAAALPGASTVTMAKPRSTSTRVSLHHFIMGQLDNHAGRNRAVLRVASAREAGERGVAWPFGVPLIVLTITGFVSCQSRNHAPVSAPCARGYGGRLWRP